MQTSVQNSIPNTLRGFLQTNGMDAEVREKKDEKLQHEQQMKHLKGGSSLRKSSNFPLHSKLACNGSRCHHLRLRLLHEFCLRSHV